MHLPKTTISEFHHVAIAVSDMQRSIAFYSQLGFRPVKEWKSEDGQQHIVHARCVNFILEIFCMSPVAPAPPGMDDLETDLSTIGTKHFGMRVPDVREAEADLRRLGIVPVTEIKEGRTGILYFFIMDPDRNWIEIVQDDRGI